METDLNELTELFKKAVTGDSVRVCQMHCGDWNTLPQGVVGEVGDTLVLNDKDVLYQGPRDEWRTNEEVLVRYGDQFWKGQNPATREDWDSCRHHADSSDLTVVEKDDSLVVNGTTVYQGNFESWRPHKYGAMFRQDCQFFLVFYKG